MNASSKLYLLFSLLGLALLNGCAAWQQCPMHAKAPIEAGTQADGNRQDLLYTCDCGSKCNCNSGSMKPGNCACGVAMKWGHIVKVEGNEGLLCMSHQGCKCTIDKNDPTKCGCGSPLKRVNLKGSAINFCNSADAAIRSPGILFFSMKRGSWRSG